MAVSRYLALASALLTAVAVVQLVVEGGTPALYWLLGSLAVLLIAVIWAYHDLWTENERLRRAAKSNDDRWEQLETRLRSIQVPRMWLSLQDDPDAPIRFADDPVYQWAYDTFELLLAKFPAHADAFIGESYATLGRSAFGLAYGSYCQAPNHGRGDYLEARGAMVREMLRAKT